MAGALAVGALGALGCSDDGGGDPEAFCAGIQEITSIEQLVGAPPAEQDPATSLRAAGERLRDLSGDAPGEIAGDVRRLADAVETLADAAADPDVGVAARLAELDREELTDAAADVEAYVRDECGVDLGGSTTTAVAPSTTAPPTAPPG